MRNRSVTCAASTLPAAERTPDRPDGTRTVTVECEPNEAAGVKVIVLPLAVQAPGTAGLTLAIGEPAASGAENTIVTGAAPLTWCEARAGVTDRTRNGPLTLAARRAWAAASRHP